MGVKSVGVAASPRYGFGFLKPTSKRLAAPTMQHRGTGILYDCKCVLCSIPETISSGFWTL
jgi:hypothetical protein